MCRETVSLGPSHAPQDYLHAGPLFAGLGRCIAVGVSKRTCYAVVCAGARHERICIIMIVSPIVTILILVNSILPGLHIRHASTT